jgi:hypothetical protein
MINVDDITPERVRQVLRQLARGRMPGRTALTELEVIRRSLEDAGFHPTPAAREYELGRLVVELAERELAVLRRRAALNAATDRPDLALQADFGHGLRELESWSAMYHLYMRPDLDLTLKGFAEFLDDRHRRTVQRRLRRGVAALTGRLQATERAARLAAATESCAAHIPAATTTTLVGVDGLLRRLSSRLADPAGGPLLALRGPGGIGKTALAQALAKDAVRRQRFELAAWVNLEDMPQAGVDDLVSVISRQAARTHDASPTLAETRALLARRPTLVVLDGVDAPDRAATAVAALAVIGGASRAVVTGRVGWSAWPDMEVLDVPALDHAAAAELLRHEVDRRGLMDVANASAAVLGPVVRATGGHPLAIRLAAAQLRADEPANVAAEFSAGTGPMAGLARELWSPAWHDLSPDACSVVQAACVADDPPANRAELATATGFSAARLTAALAEALDAGLLQLAIDVGQRGYRPGLFLRRFLLRLV